MLHFYDNMSLIEIISFILIFNFFQFVITNMFSELFWSSHKFNRTHQNLFKTHLLFSFVEIVTKITTFNVFKKTFFVFNNSKKKQIIYTVLNNLFGPKIHLTKSSNVYNKNLLNFINLCLYTLCSFVFKIIEYMVNPFQRKFINVYTVLLQLNRLPLRAIPNSIKVFFIYIVNIESWILFFKRIKNHRNLYITRQKKYPFINRLWTVYFRNKSIYYSELNIKRVHSNEISNFYYHTRIVDQSGKTSDVSYNVIFFYYLNKISLVNYPYLYWTYILTYFKYNYCSYAVNTSQHVRAQILYLLINQTAQFNEADLYYSFYKLNFYTFKGVKNTLQYIMYRREINFLPSKAISNDMILTPLEENLKLFEKSFYKKYITFYKNPKNYKFYINSIIFSNYINFQRLTSTYFLNIPMYFKIIWYNKLHNTTLNTVTNSIIMYIRAAKHFNKGRYSRNRQLYRTGVYWCIWLNVVIVYALHFYFYRVVFAFGYLWIPLGLMMLTIFSSRLYKYRYYNISQITLEFKEYLNFLFYIYLKVKNIVLKNLNMVVNAVYKFILNYIWLLRKLLEHKLASIKIFFNNIGF